MQKALSLLRLYRRHVFLTAMVAGLLISAVFSYSLYRNPLPVQAANITISGVIWDIDVVEFDCDATNLTVRVKVNGLGSYSTTCTDPAGAYSISGVIVNASDMVTVFVDDASVRASHIFRAATSPVSTTAELVQEQIFVRHDDSGPITNANLGSYDADDNANIDFQVSGTTLTTNSGIAFTIKAGSTFTPSGVVNANGVILLETGAVMTLGVAGSSIAQLYMAYGAATTTINATTTIGSGGVQFATGSILQTTSGTPTLTVAGSMTGNSVAVTAHHLVLNGTTQSIGATTIAGDMTISSGTTTTTGTIAVSGTVSVAAGATLVTGSTVNVTGSLTTTTSGVVQYSGTPTVTVQGSTIGGGSGNILFYNLTKSGAGTTTWTGSGVNQVINTLSTTAGTLVTPSLLYVKDISSSGGAINAPNSTIFLNQSADRTLSLSGSVGNIIINDGLVGHWKFDETSGTAPADSSMYGHTGGTVNTPTIDTDVPTTQFTNARSLTFNGTSQYVNIGNPAILDNQFTDQITLSAWIKPNTIFGFHTIVGKSNNAGHIDPYYNWALIQAGDAASCRIGATSLLASAGTVTSGSWQHFTCIYNGSTIKLYKNGAEIASTPKTGNMLTSTRDVRIGGRDTTSLAEYFSGSIDEVRIYGRAISTADVAAIGQGSEWGLGAATVTLGSSLSVTNDLTLVSGKLHTSGSSHAISVGGNWSSVGGQFDAQAGTVTLNGTASGKTITSGRQRFANLTVNGSGGAWTLADRLIATGTLTIQQGTLDVSATNYNIRAGTLNQTGGTFTPRSGTVILTAQSAQSVALSSSLNALRIEDASETNLAGYWKLDEGAGTTASDSSGNGRDGTATNNPAWTTSLNSTTVFDNISGLDHDGVDDYVTMGNVINAGDTSDLTISGWFYRDTFASDDVLLAKRNGNTAGDVGYVVWIDASTDRLRFEASDGTDEFELSSTATFTSTGWNHFVIVWDQDSTGASEIYINGADNNATQTGTIGNVGDLTNAVALRLGAESDAGAPFDGKLDDVRIYSAALSATEAGNIGAGKYANGASGTATFTASGSATIPTLALDSGTFNSGTATPTITNLLSLVSGNGAYVGGSATQTLNGGLTVSASTFTGGAGTIDINGTATLSGGTVTTGSGNWSVSGSFTHSGSTFTASAGHTLTMDGTGTLTSNGQTLQNLTINSAGTVTLAAATHTVAGSLVLGGAGTPTVTGSTITMTGTANTIDGGGKTLQNLTIDPASTGTITLQNTDLTVATALTVASNDTLALSASRTLTLSGNSGTTLTLNGTISGAGRLTYQNSATTLPTTGTLSAVTRFDMVNGAQTVPARTYGGVEVYNNTGSSRTATLAAGSHILTGSLLLLADGAGNTVYAGAANNPTVTIAGDVDYTGSGGGAESITSGTGAWSIGGNVDFTGGTWTAASGNTVTLTGTAVNLTSNSQPFYNLTVDPASAGTVSLLDSVTLTNTLVVAANDTVSIASGQNLNISAPATLNGTITGAGTFVVSFGGTFGTTGTISSNLTLNAAAGDMTLPTRSYLDASRTVRLIGDFTTVTIGHAAGALSIAGNLLFDDSDGTEASMDAAVNDPTVTIGGDVSNFAGSFPNISFGSGQWTVAGNVDLDSSSQIDMGTSTLVMTGTNKTLSWNFDVMYGLSIPGSVTATTALVVGNDLTVDGTFTAPSSTLTLRNNLDVNGSIIGNGGTVIFTASSTGKTIECGSSTFHHMTFDNATGGWTIQANDCSIGGNLTLTNAQSLTVSSGRTLSVSGSFTNSLTSGATTWTGSTLALIGSGTSTINSKASSGDTYGTLHLAGTHQAFLWNSSAGTITFADTAGLVSQDDGAVDGRLALYGTTHSRSNEYWTYATDFDGAALGTPRAVTVAVAPASSVIVDSADTLTILGQSYSTNRTSIDRQGSSGSYGITIQGTLDAEFFTVQHLGATGLSFASTAVITTLDSGVFDNAGVASASYLTLSSPTSTLTTNALVFDSVSDGTDANASKAITASGSGVNWTMVAAAGNRTGSSATTTSSGATVTWDIPTLTVKDGLGADSDITTSLLALSANWSASSTTTVSTFSYSIGTTSGGANIVSDTNVGGAVSVTASGLTLTEGQTYYVTIVARNSLLEPLFSATSDGILTDASAPTISSFAVSGTTTTLLVSWITSELATQQVFYGTTTDLSSETSLESSLSLSHSVTISDLTAGTTYYVQGQSVDQAGNVVTSEVLTIQTTVASTVSGGGLPIPALFKPILQRSGTDTILTVTGIARESKYVRLYVDGRIVSTTKLRSSTGVVSFAIRLPFSTLRPGRHQYTVRAVSTTGRVSLRGNLVPFVVDRTNSQVHGTVAVATTYLVQPGDSLWRIANLYVMRNYQAVQDANVKKFPKLLLNPSRLLMDIVLSLPKVLR